MKIIFENDEGGIAIVTPIINNDIDMTLKKIIAKDIPKGKPFEIVEDIVIPLDRTFRNAWKKGIGKIEIDMPKARIIHMNRIRKIRNDELDKSDKEIVLAIENGVNLNILKTKRQKLRDIPQNFKLDLAITSKDLNAMWPTELPREKKVSR